MCEAGGVLQIYQQQGNFVKGKIGHHSFYTPRKGGARIATRARMLAGCIVNATLVRGMLVRLQSIERR